LELKQTIEPLTESTSQFPESWSNDRKNLELNQLKSLNKKTENKHFIICANANKYESFKMQDRLREEKQKKSNEQRHKVLSDKQTEIEHFEMSKKLRAEEQRIENERRAEECRLLESNLTQDFADMKHIKPKNTKQKKKMIRLMTPKESYLGKRRRKRKKKLRETNLLKGVMR